MSTEQTTCADAVVGTLIGHGIRTAYALPGVQNDWLFNALHDRRDALRVVHTRHEQGAAYMALGAALATGEPALYAVVPGPGLLNTTAALATAYSANAPVFALSGQIASRTIGRGFGALHEIPNQTGILRTLTKWADCALEPGQAAGLAAEAFRQMRTGRPRPVGLEIPPDILAARGEFEPAAPLPVEAPPAPDGDALQRAVDLLAGAARPMIIIGGGTQHAAPSVRALAERLGAPVLSYRMGKGVLDDRHALAVNIPAAYRLWKDTDVVLALGTRAHPALAQWGVDEDLSVIKVDIDPEETGRIGAPTVGLTGDADVVAKALLAGLGNRPAPADAARVAAAKQAVAAELETLAPQLAYLRAIRAALPEDGIFVEELTQVGYVSRLAFPVYQPRQFLSTGYQGTLGWGVAAALGAQDARPDVPVVAVMGDGGFMFNVQELATAAQFNIPAVCIVFNDGAYGNVQRMQKEDYGNRVIASDLRNPDFLRLADSFGVRAWRAAEPAALERAIRDALPARAPALIEVPCGEMPGPWRFTQLPRIRGRRA